MSTLEIWANLANLLSVVLAARNHLLTWPIGIFGCALYGWMFFGAKLYADVTLQVFFACTSAVGWWSWRKGGLARKELVISHARGKIIGLCVLFSLITAAMYGSLLHATTDAVLPFADSLVLTFSISAQFLLMARKVETWLFWLVVNTLCVPLFASRELYLTSVVYALFWINACFGYLVWKRRAGALHA